MAGAPSSGHLVFLLLWTALWVGAHADAAPNATLPSQACKSVAWFMGVRAVPGAEYNNVKAALMTAKTNAPSVVPCLIWSGAASPVTAWFARQGGRVYFHDLTFAAELPREQAEDTGAYLRLDLPLVLKAVGSLGDGVDIDYVMFTDPDVLFLADINACSIAKPKILALGTQNPSGAQARASAGVMYMNVTAMAEHRDRLVEFGRARQFSSGSAHALTKAYFKASMIAQLPMRFNWKPYWGGGDASTTISLVHFYGPKPGVGLECLLQNRAGRERACTSVPASYRELFTSAPDGATYYNHCLQVFFEFLHKAESS